MPDHDTSRITLIRKQKTAQAAFCSCSTAISPAYHSQLQLGSGWQQDCHELSDLLLGAGTGTVHYLDDQLIP